MQPVFNMMIYPLVVPFPSTIAISCFPRILSLTSKKYMVVLWLTITITENLIQNNTKTTELDVEESSLTTT